jgi:hypothetical protein
MIKCNLIDLDTSKALDTMDTARGDIVLGISTEGASHGVFKTATRSTAGTKKAGTLIVQFADGANTVIIATFYLTDAPLAVAIPFAGRWQGWQSARLEMVTSIVANVTVTLGYYKVDKPGSLSYDDWSAIR